MLKRPENITPEVQQILDNYDAEQKTIQSQHNKALGRIGGGTALMGLSALPIFNVPYVGTGVGGALYDAGQAIVEGDKLPDIAKRAGRGFVIGETVGAIPYAGKFVGKTKAGQAIGELGQGLGKKFMDSSLGQKVAEIAPKVEDLLMTDIKAFNPNKQIVYHGSPKDFNKFTNEAIGTGEGAQAHGYGHYAAKNKDVAQEYADRLSSNLYSNLSKIENTPLKSLTDGTKTSLQIDGRDITEARLKNDLSYYKNKLQDMEIKGTYIPEVNQKYIQKIQEFQNDLNLLNNFDESILTSDKQLYKLSIPKDDVMLREGVTLAEQPKLLNRLGMNNTDNVTQEMTNLLDYIKNNKSSLPSEELNNLRKQYSDLSYKKMLNNPQLKSEVYYEALTDSLGSEQLANEFLLDKGIKGISYNGGIDGEARVIFNPDDIDIVRKYYNQPQAIEYFQKFNPSLGAVVNNIENNPVNTKEWKQYAKKNLIGNSVDVPGYTTVNFTNKNLGKDYPYNMPEYPTLLDDLANSKYAFSTNYNNETDRLYDHLVNNKKGLYDYLIEVIKDNKGNIHHNYKMMKNINRGDKP
ncbi:MAG: hypothetical protein II304_03030 [Bacteroidales bacterium]|nr:hypothetical protein [Bacteroidales bacterium]